MTSFCLLVHLLYNTAKYEKKQVIILSKFVQFVNYLEQKKGLSRNLETVLIYSLLHSIGSRHPASYQPLGHQYCESA